MTAAAAAVMLVHPDFTRYNLAYIYADVIVVLIMRIMVHANRIFADADFQRL